ncbi:hypothetical protein ACFVVU_30700 [Kitasatospora sp. NPDC057965]|uniref:hypothetical protein n=1 Tax=Kitasatospora sp. NPDC057965 TaxID=3346291 RepID=UPI0036DB33C0
MTPSPTRRTAASPRDCAPACACPSARTAPTSSSRPQHRQPPRRQHRAADPPRPHHRSSPLTLTPLPTEERAALLRNLGDSLYATAAYVSAAAGFRPGVAERLHSALDALARTQYVLLDNVRAEEPGAEGPSSDASPEHIARERSGLVQLHASQLLSKAALHIHPALDAAYRSGPSTGRGAPAVAWRSLNTASRALSDTARMLHEVADALTGPEPQVLREITSRAPGEYAAAAVRIRSRPAATAAPAQAAPTAATTTAATTGRRR